MVWPIPSLINVFTALKGSHFIFIIYDEAKMSLKTFKGDIKRGNINIGSSIKLEPTSLAENEEALLAAG